jgi:branched-chain amino acid transport system substrate-binding protein
MNKTEEIMRKVTMCIALATCMAFLFGIGVPAYGQAQKPYKIGAILPLTGYLSWLGEYMKKGGELKVEMINKAGGVNGRPIEWVAYDDQSSPETGTKVTQRLISKDEVIALQGTGSVPISAAVSSVANKSKVPVILQSGYQLSDKETFSFNNAHKTAYAFARPLMYFEKKGISKVALLMPIGPLGELGSAMARKHAPDYKIEILGEEKFDVKAPDVTTQLAKLRALKPEAIMAFATGEPAALLARNMDQMGIKIPLVVSHGNANPGFLKLVSNCSTPVIVPAGKIMDPQAISDKDPTKKVIMEFAKAYQEKYGEPANYYAGQQADAVALIAEALRISKSDDPVKLRDAIESIKGFPGCNGVYNMSPTDHQGNALEDMILLTIKDGKWQALN